MYISNFILLSGMYAYFLSYCFSLFRSYVTSPSSYLCAGGTLLFYFAFSFCMYPSIVVVHISAAALPSFYSISFEKLKMWGKEKENPSPEERERERSNIRTYAYIKPYAAIYQSTLLHSFWRCIYILGILSFLFFYPYSPFNLLHKTREDPVSSIHNIILFFTLKRKYTHRPREKKQAKVSNLQTHKYINMWIRMHYMQVTSEWYHLLCNLMCIFSK